ncbi:MAG TPA: glycosyltransferase [Terriglobales bacterium]|nr:glycosyltransferase [Terriglobales bacterium]
MSRRSIPSSESKTNTPPVSILKPLQGISPELKGNLATFCNLDYPEFELIFCVEKKDDPALQAVAELQKECAQAKIKIAAEDPHQGYNPKVRNLLRGMSKATHDLILISDADVQVGRNYLKDLVSFSQDLSTGIVTNLIRGKGNDSLGSRLENLNLNFFVLGGTCFLYHFFRYAAVTGKSVLMKRKDLEKIGGFSSVENFLAEDQILEKKFKRLGRKIVLSHLPIDSNTSGRTFGRFFKRNVRWSQMRMQLGGIGYLSELMLNPFLFALLLCITSWFSVFSLKVLFFIAIFKMIAESVQGRLVRAEAGFLSYLLVPLKDILIGIIWFSPFFKTSVEWRESKFRLRRYTELEPL